MPRALTNGKVKIGAFMFPDRKKPMIGVCKSNNEVIVYGSFRDTKSAEEFMHELSLLIGCEEESINTYDKE